MTLREEQIFVQIADIVKQTAGAPTGVSLDRTASFDDIGINSLKRVHIITKLEKWFDIEFGAEDLISERLQTLGGLCDCVTEKIAPIATPQTHEHS